MCGRKTCLLVCVIFFTLAFFCQKVCAESFGTLSTTLKKGQWMLNLEGSGTINRDLKYEGGKVKSQSWGAYHARGYGLTDRINVFAKIGYQDLNKIDPNPFTNETANLKGGVSFGISLKGLILKEPENPLEVAIGGSFLYTTAYFDNGPKRDWREWQLGIYTSKQFFSRFGPYIGIKYADLDSRLKFEQKEDEGQVEGGFIDVNSDKKIGIFVGANVYLNKDKDVYLNCEINFVSSLEFGAGIYYKF